MSFGMIYFNPRAPCGARLRIAYIIVRFTTISIHAPRVGRDSYDIITYGYDMAFQSTRPVWGATVPVYTGLITAVALYFSRTSFLAVLLQAFFVAKSSV
mgnify:CR=1 FL=1